MAIDFGDIASRYANARLDQATQPFTDPEAYMNNRMQQQYGIDMNGNTKPVSTTINYGDNGQPETITTKHEIGQPEQAQPEQVSPAAYQAPQMPMAAPAAMPIQQPVPQQMPQPMARPVAQPMPQQQMPQGPVTPQQMAQPAPQQAPAPVAQPTMGAGPSNPQAAAQPVNLPPLPQAGPPVQVAGPAAMPSAAPAPQAMPAAAPAPATMPTVNPEGQLRSWTDDIAAIQGNMSALGGYIANENNPEEGRKFAGRVIAKMYKEKDLQDQAQQKVMAAVQTGDLLPIVRESKKNTEEGSYLKAYLFSRLGLNDLAKEEQQKLGAGSTWKSVTGPNGERALIKFSGDGLPTEGLDEAGKSLKMTEVARLATNAMPTQSHLLPSVHGTPVINGQGQTGLMMYDPQTRSTYVQVGQQRLPTNGWTTMAQNVNNVYNAAGAHQQGVQAAQGYTNQPLPPVPGPTPQPAGTTATPPAPQGNGPVNPAAMVAPAPAAAPAQQTATPAQVGGAPAPQAAPIAQPARVGVPLPAVSGIPAVGGGPVYKQQQATEIGTAAAKKDIEVAGARSQSFNKYIDENVTPEANNGDAISSTRKQQFALFNRPGVDAGKIFGIANGAGQAPGDQRWTMFRDVLLGKVSEPADRIRERAAALGLNREEQSAAAEYAIMNADINSKTLKASAGPGSVSDAEQKINQERNVRPTDVPMLGGYNAMAQSQFAGDLARYKGDWANTSTATNTAKLESEWRKEKDKINKLYIDMAKQRIEYISKMNNTPAAIKEGYRLYPVPEYNPQTGEWIKKKPLTNFDR